MRTTRLLVLICSIAITLYLLIPELAWHGAAAPQNAQHKIAYFYTNQFLLYITSVTDNRDSTLVRSVLPLGNY